MMTASDKYELFDSYPAFKKHVFSNERGSHSAKKTVYITNSAILDTEDSSKIQFVANDLNLKYVAKWLESRRDYEHYHTLVDLKSFDEGILIYKSDIDVFSEKENCSYSLTPNEINEFSKQLLFFLKNPHPMCHIYCQFGYWQSAEDEKLDFYVLKLIDIADLYAEKMHFLNKHDIELGFSDKKIEDLKKKDFGDAKARWLARKRFSERWGVTF